MTDHAFGGAAEPGVLQARVAVRGQHNHVRTQRLGRLVNYFERLSVADI